MKKIVLAVMFFVSLSNSQEIDIWDKLSDQYSSSKKQEDITSKSDQSNSIDSPQYTSKKTKQDSSVEPTHSYNDAQIGVVQGLDPHGDGFLSLRVKPKSKEIGRLYNGDELEILDKSGKYYKVLDKKSYKIGWAHHNWIKIISDTKFLLADIDYDGKQERLQWYHVDVNVDEGYYQLKLFDDNGDLLWKGNNSIARTSPFENAHPATFDDIDQDANTELVIWNPPNEGYSRGSETYRWTGKNFIRISSNKPDLVWVDAPSGNTLKWTKIDDKEYSKRKKIWWVSDLSQMSDNELPVAEIAGVQYPEYMAFFKSKAKIRFIPTGAIIEEWISREEYYTSGIDTYKENCEVCHDTDLMGAPAVGDKAAWTAVLEKGIDQVYHNAINGKGGMPPKGGAMNLTDSELKKAVDYMVGASK